MMVHINGAHQIELTPQRTSEKLSQMKPKFEAKMRDFSVGCIGCEAVFHALLFYLKRNESESEIMEALTKICHTLPEKFHPTCDSIAGSIAKFLPLLPELAKRQNYDVKALCSMIQYCEIDCCVTKEEPEQIHLSYLGDRARGVTWTTLEKSCAQVKVREIGKNDWTTIEGNITTYHKGGWVGYIMMARMDESNLPGDSNDYEYKVGCDATYYSQIYHFTLTQKRKHLVIADMGNKNSENTMRGLLDKAHLVDTLLISGDQSYADGYQAGWDVFLRSMQPISANLPTQTLPGNHEIGVVGQLNLAGYPFRFYMPYEQPWDSFPEPYLSNLVYSYETDLVSWITLDSESILDLALMSDFQVNWLTQQLKAVNRTRTPWVIVSLHRPLYCSTNVRDCNAEAAYFRSRLEETFLTYHVDLVITGHRHFYERTYPVANNTLVSKSYDNPKAPVYMVVGNAGNREGLSHFNGPVLDWSASRISKYGYGLLEVEPTTLKWSMFESETNDVMDSWTITKS